MKPSFVFVFLLCVSSAIGLGVATSQRHTAHIAELDAGQIQHREIVDLDNPNEEKTRFKRQSTDDDHGRTGGVVWNDAVDIIFSYLKDEILITGKDKFSITNLRKNFDYKISFINIKGNFQAENGSVSNMTSLRRTDNVSVVKDVSDNGTVYRMTCFMQFDTLKVRYEKYEIKMLGKALRGFIEGSVEFNKLRVKLNFENKNSECVTTLDEIKIVQLDGLKVRVSGFHGFDWLGSAVATRIIQKRIAEIKANIELALTKEAVKATTMFHCDEYASLLML